MLGRANLISGSEKKNSDLSGLTYYNNSPPAKLRLFSQAAQLLYNKHTVRIL